ncbi:MAG: GTPase [Lachnospiraceae bacterium]|nr:GTPase [Lachnospiraceae bacterium]
MIPVYIINGFLDSGKTEFINYTISQPYFQTRDKTLLIVCEEGEVEYDPALLKKSRTSMELVEEEKDFTNANLTALEKKHRPGRIIIEWNGMWNFKDMKLPRNWEVEQQITMIDGSTFQLYYTNMRSLLAEMIRKTEMVIMNRCDGLDEQLPSFKRNLKAVNQQMDVVFENAEGEMSNLFEEDLPYDLKADVIELDDSSYGIWFIDTMDHVERYVGKTFSYLAQVGRPDDYPKGYFLPGRLIMTCCAEDISFFGFACEYAGAEGLRVEEWVKVTARMDLEEWMDYEGKGPVMKAVSIVKVKGPKERVISFS